MKLVDRLRNLPAPHPAESLHLERGKLADYGQLAEHHYRADKPATAMRVLIYRTHEPTLAARFVGRSDTGQVAAVLVESLPSLSCSMRNWALHERFGRWLPATQRSRMLNREVRCISRVVVHPQWRGLGLAVRLVKAALADACTPYTEALAAMGRVNPFFERAGMTAYRRPMHPCDARLLAALARVGIVGHDLATLDRTWQRITHQPENMRRWLVTELHRWYRNNGGRSATRNRDPRTHLRAAQQRLLLQPVYYLHDNRSVERIGPNAHENNSHT
ncbi:hypothetical protein ACERK3_15290 [Phycisphaerales bacterium AB-hyl4]|uniref:Acetyltransferase (GNAT) family protein n=1 Tax=Natronomicrosphaera hydrolytica TaxID=3242702 RepID=A0ABV4UA20_9BACT